MAPVNNVARITVFAMTVILVMAIAACSKSQNAEPTPTTSRASPTHDQTLPTDRPGENNADREPGTPGSLPGQFKPVLDTTPVDTKVMDVTMSNAGDEHQLTGPVHAEFQPHDSVFLDVRTNGSASKYTISMKWLYPNGETLTENSQIVNEAGPTSTIFSMSKPDGWSPGKYSVEISINGKLSEKQSFEVR